MKKLITAFWIVLCGLGMNAQDISVENEVFGAELGLVKADVFYEFKLDRKLALRTELAIDLNTYSYDNFQNESISGTIVPLSLVVEPRFYYGIDRRNRLGRNISHNSSNYFSLKTVFAANRNPIYKADEEIRIVNAILVLPSFGIRRSFAKSFSYEFSTGFGLGYNLFSNSHGCNCDHLDSSFDLQAKIGYAF